MPRLPLLLLLLLPLLAAPDAPAPTHAERLGYPPDAKLLLLHADDIGVAHSVNAATFDAFATGRVRSGSVMVPCAWFPEAAAYARAHPDHDLGLHLTLTSEWKHYRWGPVLGAAAAPSLVDSLGFLHATPGAAAAAMHPAAAAPELRAQVERALAFGLHPTHLDSHMGTLFQTPDLFAAYVRVGRDYGLPVFVPREALAAQAPQLLAMLSDDELLVDRLVMAPDGVDPADFDAFYTRAIQTLQPGVTELIVHLAYDDAEMQAVTVDHPAYGATWRQRDFDFFTSPAFDSLRAAHDVHLVTYRELAAARAR
ncbi:MAG: polysaccharide deacetylase family protein [Rhodothermales bacterium]|nr:polysaccharide deacetylase family protein [Rhodothermales bacterium]